MTHPSNNSHMNDDSQANQPAGLNVPLRWFVALGAAFAAGILSIVLTISRTARRPNSAFVMRMLLVAGILAGIGVFSEQKSAKADVLLPDQKSVSYCYQFANLKDFPDYVIVATYEPLGSPQMVKDGECVSFYKLSRTTFYATKAAGFTTAQLPKDNSNRTFFSSNPVYIPSKVSVQPVSAVDKKDPRSKVVDVLKIVAVNSSEAQIEKSSVIYTYTNGKTETLPYLNQQDRPQPSNATSPVLPDLMVGGVDLNWLWFAAVPVLALAVLALLIFRRKKQPIR